MNATQVLASQLIASAANSTLLGPTFGLNSSLLNSTESNKTSESLSILEADQTAATKLIASLVLFLITLLCGYLPVKMILNQDYIQHAMFAGGGVLMATAFCHLIPETHDSYRESLGGGGGGAHQASHSHSHTHHNNETMAAPEHEHKHEHEFEQTWTRFENVPLVEVTLCCGFFFMYLIEQLMVRFINNHSHEHPCDTTNSTVAAAQGRLTHFSDSQSADDGQSRAFDSTAGSAASVGDLSATAIIPGAQTRRSNQFDLSSNNSSTATTNNKRATEFYKFLRGLLIISAFGAHSIFDGVAIGSQETEEKVWTIFFAISCHKLIIAAVVGLELFAATLESHLWTLVHLIAFSLMSPIGIILVVVAQNSLKINSNDPTMILLQSFATGTLLYIIFVEILQPKEEQNIYDSKPFRKSFSLLAGFALMLIVLTVIS